jgi:hypothetical protein
MSRARRVRLLVVLVALGPGALPAQQSSLTIGLSEAAANQFRGEPGRRVLFVCPAITEPAGPVWGTDVYTADSVVCSAAIHAGVLSLGRAGPVWVVIGAGAETFPGSDRNGVRTESYGAWPYSFTFDRGGAPPPISWTTTAYYLPPDFDTPLTVLCPAFDGSIERGAWGTDTYTSDSGICVAAVHAGAITRTGGTVTIQPVPPPPNFSGSERNGVVSREWGAYDGAFTVVGSSAASDPAGPRTRTIALVGFQAAGATPPPAAPPPPRFIETAGFSAAGTAAPPPTAPPPRVISLPGWTASTSPSTLRRP